MQCLHTGPTLPLRTCLVAVVLGLIAPFLPAQQTGPAHTSSAPEPAPVVAQPDNLLNLNAPHSALNPLGDASLEARLQRIHTEEQRKRMVVDAKRLVVLTERYRTAVQQHGMPTPDDQILLAQIEKLARDVEARVSDK